MLTQFKNNRAFMYSQIGNASCLPKSLIHLNWVLLFLISTNILGQNRINLSLEFAPTINESYAAHPLSFMGEFQMGKKKRLFLRSGINASNRGAQNIGIPLFCGFYTHPASKNHFEIGLGTTLLVSEQLPPYNSDKNFDVGPNGISILLAYRRELPLGWYLKLGLTPFLSFESSIVPSLSIGYRIGANKKDNAVK
jgi:hypothetical protein